MNARPCDNKNQHTSVFDDTDSLINNDSVVVFNERTALCSQKPTHECV